MRELLLVGAGGFIGAVARYGLSLFARRTLGPGFPWGTLAVNALGCLAIGALMTWALEARAGEGTRLFVAVGCLGAFTTFSTFGYETVELVRAERLGAALASVAANVVLGIGAVVAGRALVLWLSR